MGRRFLRFFLIGLVLLLLGGLWAFSFFLFNPFEGSYGYPIASLIDRDVDFYFAKTNLRDDFDPFPRLAFVDDFAASRSGQALHKLALSDLIARWKVEESLAQLDQALAQMPVSVDPLSVFGGRALALAGNFRGGRVDDADWAVYGRTSWLGKLAVELVAGGWIDLSAQGIQVKPFEEEGERLGVSLSGGSLPRPIFLARVQDVVLVATSGAALSAARRFEDTRGQDSFGLSARYADDIAREGRTGDELELFLDQRSLAENLKLPGTLPDPQSKDLVTALLAKLFQLGALREVIGTVDFDKTLTLELVGELSSNVLTPFQQRLYDERGFDKDQIKEVASLAPADAGLFVYVHADIGALLRELRSVVMAIDPKAISNLEDVVRSAWNYPDLDPLIDDLDAAFRDRLAFFVRNYDYQDEGEDGPPHDDIPVPAWAVVLWIQDEAKVNELRGVLHRRDTAQLLGISGREPGTNGIWKNTLEGGAEVHEYWNPFIPGTGRVATLEMKGREPYLVVTNVLRLLGKTFKTYHSGEEAGASYTRLAENAAFLPWVNNGLPSANALVWFAPSALSAINRRMAAWRVDQNAADYIDWNVERPRIEREVIAKNFPGASWGNVPPEDQESYERLVTEEVERFEAKFLEQTLPSMQAQSQQLLDAWEIVNNSFFELDSEKKRLRLHGRIGLSFAASE